jgi:hypothetical protein
MTYVGHVQKGIVIFEGSQRPPDGTAVRIEEIPAAQAKNWGEVFKDLIGSVEGLPEDMAENHDHYIHGTPKK